MVLRSGSALDIALNAEARETRARVAPMNSNPATPRHSHLVAAVLVSVLLHTFILIVFRAAPAHLDVSEGQRAFPLQMTLRAYRSRAISMDNGQTESTRSTNSHPTEKITRKPAASVDAPSVRSEAVNPAAQETTRPGSTNENSAYPSIDLEAGKRIARETDRARERSLAELAALGLPESETATVLSRGILKAGRPDCRGAHAGMGLLAIAFLVKDAITDNGCKW